jgi:hypothetical protein
MTRKTLPLAALWLFAACSSRKVDLSKNPFLEIPSMSFSTGEVQQKGELRFVFQGNVKGELGTCGCAFQPTGGIDRKFNFLRTLKGSFLYLDSGNALFPNLTMEAGEREQLMRRALQLAKAHVKLGVSLQNVGRYDLVLGAKFLKQVEKESKIQLLSSNLLSQSDDFVFLPFKNFVTETGVSVSVVGFSNPTAEEFKEEGFKIVSPLSQLKLLLSKIPQDHLLVILSDLSAIENQELSELADRPHIVIGSSGFESYKIPLHQAEGVQLQGLPLGQELGLLDFVWKSDAKTWFNQGAKEGFARRYSELLKERKYFGDFPASKDRDAELAKNTNDLEALLKFIPPQGSSFIAYRAQTVTMDDRFAAKNELSKIIQKYK